MKFLFIADPLESFKVDKDSTLAMMRVTQGAGHEIWFTQSHDLLWGQGKARARCQTIQIQDGVDWYVLGEFEEHPLEFFSAVLMRQDPPFTVEYLTSTWILSAAVLQGAKVFNSPDAVRNYSEKLSITEFPQFIPPTLVTRDIHAIRDFHRLHRDIVVKQLDGRCDGHILAKHIPVSRQYPISFLAKHTISHLHNVINIMQRMSKLPFTFHTLPFNKSCWRPGTPNPTRPMQDLSMHR